MSTTDKGQNPEMQLAEMRAYCTSRDWQIVTEATDTCSGAKETRPELNRLMEMARRRAIDVIVVWKLDRFGRSLKHLVNSLAELEALGVAFVSLRDQIGMTTPAGRLQLHILAAMAEFERALICERVRAGIARAKATGKTWKRGRNKRYRNGGPSSAPVWPQTQKSDFLAEL